MEHFSNDHEDHPNQHNNSHKLCDETSRFESVGKPMETETMIRISQWKENHCRINTSVKKEINPKEHDCKSHSQGSK